MLLYLNFFGYKNLRTIYNAMVTLPYRNISMDMNTPIDYLFNEGFIFVLFFQCIQAFLFPLKLVNTTDLNHNAMAMSIFKQLF